MPSSKIKAFTIIELLATLTIVAILAAISAPNFISVIQNNRMTTQSNELMTSLALARSEAITRGVQVSICKSNDQVTTPTCGGSWQDGWVVFVDTSTANGSIDSGEEVLRVHEPLSENTTLKFVTAVSPASDITHISYTNDGLAPNAANNYFTLCDSRGDTNRKGIQISPTGRVKRTSSNVPAC